MGGILESWRYKREFNKCDKRIQFQEKFVERWRYSEVNNLREIINTITYSVCVYFKVVR